MPSAGIHGLTGLAFASCVTNPYMKLGMILGSMLPDADLIVSGLAYLITKDIEIGKKIHRSWSHSFIIHSMLGILGGGIFGIFPSAAHFLLGLAAMMVFHSILDYFYIGYMTISDLKNKVEPGIAFLAPFSFKKWAFYPKVFSDKVYNIWMAADFLFDPILPGFFLFFSYQHQTNVEIFTFVFVVTIFFAIAFLVFIFLSIFSDITADNFTIIIHYPGLFFLCFILIAPLLFWETLLHL